MPYMKQAVLDELLRSGNLCSNACYNIAQNHYTCDADRATLKNAYTRWDEAKAAFRASLKK